MNKLFTLLQLMLNFIKDALLSGWDTACFILRQPSTAGGLTRMNYGELSSSTASVLAMLITLTPGTTVVRIDLEKHEFVLHLLDLEQGEAVLDSIRQNFIAPLTQLTGEGA